MKSEMTVAEAKKCKLYLEQLFLAQIKTFEFETGCSVRDIKLQHLQSVGSPPEICTVVVECVL